MESDTLASKALVYVLAHSEDGAILLLCHMDLTFGGNTFHRMLNTSARLLSPDKKVFVYLVLDASYVESIEIRNDDAVPVEVTNAFVKQSRCTASTEILSLQFALEGQVPVVSPNSTLQKRPSICKAIDALLRIGRCKTLKIFVPSQFIKKQHLPELCSSLAQRTLKPALNYILKTLYEGTGGKLVTDVENLCRREQRTNQAKRLRREVIILGLSRPSVREHDLKLADLETDA
ncbi:unnamed protein product [Aureobasidium vineae]|uniref:Uncharacterized protein n=1 Tax=Aureobasidium vineae TaxID=2773715 RepID=A0A9N8JEP1_9PEZI|nr:unnamed protein product [Aureobasidium vineae]